jgi:hypothetical protein
MTRISFQKVYNWALGGKIELLKTKKTGKFGYKSIEIKKAKVADNFT